MVIEKPIMQIAIFYHFFYSKSPDCAFALAGDRGNYCMSTSLCWPTPAKGLPLEVNTQRVYTDNRPCPIFFKNPRVTGGILTMQPLGRCYDGRHSVQDRAGRTFADIWYPTTGTASFAGKSCRYCRRR